MKVNKEKEDVAVGERLEKERMAKREARWTKKERRRWDGEEVNKVG